MISRGEQYAISLISIKVLIRVYSYAYLTQLMQSEGISLAYSLWRREWKGPGKEYVSDIGIRFGHY